MKKTYAAKRLLEHGPLTHAELLEITGWSRNTLRRALEHLLESGLVQARKISPTRNLYVLA